MARKLVVLSFGRYHDGQTRGFGVGKWTISFLTALDPYIYNYYWNSTIMTNCYRWMLHLHSVFFSWNNPFPVVPCHHNPLAKVMYLNSAVIYSPRCWCETPKLVALFRIHPLPALISCKYTDPNVEWPSLFWFLWFVWWRPCERRQERGGTEGERGKEVVSIFHYSWNIAKVRIGFRKGCVVFCT